MTNLRNYTGAGSRNTSRITRRSYISRKFFHHYASGCDRGTISHIGHDDGGRSDQTAGSDMNFTFDAPRQETTCLITWMIMPSARDLDV